MTPEPARELHRCAWCGVASSRTTGAAARLVPMPAGMVEFLGEFERRHNVRVRHDEYATTGVPASWWCRAPRACARRRGGIVDLGRG